MIRRLQLVNSHLIRYDFLTASCLFVAAVTGESPGDRELAQLVLVDLGGHRSRAPRCGQAEGGHLARRVSIGQVHPLLTETCGIRRQRGRSGTGRGASGLLATT